MPGELLAYLQDLGDHLGHVISETGELRDALSQILSVNALVAQRQNEDMKKISGWAAILFAPTLIAAVYGMNFDLMPELHWTAGYPAAVGLMIAFAVALYLVFKWKKWMERHEGRGRHCPGSASSALVRTTERTPNGRKAAQARARSG
ncbi:MAG: CorA family divalent cation transporter [Micropruina sp.]|uniref:CorA family divalent cation transporter n=1 Tax=Micropruina sp. TaxID=2737536 RepID=UPI0039E65297